MSVHPLPQVAGLLLPSDAMLVADAFRRFERFRSDYDSRHLNVVSRRLCAAMCPDLADAVISDALLVDSEIRMRAKGPFVCFNEGAPTASADEAALLNLIGAMQSADYTAAAEAAIQLEIMQARALFSLVFRLGQRLMEAGIRFRPRSFRGTAVTARVGEPRPPRGAPHLRIVDG